MNDNLFYFTLSQKLEDAEIDFSNPSGVKVITDKTSFPPDELMIKNNELVKLISTYESSKQLNFKIDDINKILYEIIKIVKTTKNINYSPFLVYFQVLKTSYNAYISIQNKLTIKEKRLYISKILDLYINNRHNMYFSHGYSDIVLQVMSDNASSRKNEKTGIDMLIKMLEPRGFKHVSDEDELLKNNFCYLLPDKGDKKLFNTILKKFNIKFDFKKNRDDKYPDMLLKICADYFIIEHKLTNGNVVVKMLKLMKLFNLIRKKKK